jgi:hypothetical protein
MRRHLVLVVVMAASFALSAPAIAAPFPDSVPLPVDFAPEGIALGTGSSFYAGSLKTGDIYRGDPRSGAGGVFIDAPAARVAAGLKADRARHLLFVAGGVTGAAYVYDSRNGAPVAAYQFAPSGAALLNDVVVTGDGAYLGYSQGKGKGAIRLRSSPETGENRLCAVMRSCLGWSG